ncbi:hypothetical protein GCM10022202_18680 [Microbacterium marinilacus]|uniref:Uncharacterized protein n=1 Tax=Microbacterium marinilacus TaxID=415209 RepID=A0ABP7BEQ5_9MICO
MSESRVTNALVGVLSILFAASVVLLVVQLTTSSAAPGNWFSRIMVSGSGAFFVTAVLWRLLEKNK